MKSNAIFADVRLFNVKPLGNGCRFGIKVSSKKQDGTYTKGVFINCKHKSMLQEGINYTLEGFFGDNEYNGGNTLEFIAITANPHINEAQSQAKYSKPQVSVNRTPDAKYQSDIPEIDINDETIPF